MSDVVEKMARALSINLTGSDWLLNDHREAAIAVLDALAENGPTDAMYNAFYSQEHMAGIDTRALFNKRWRAAILAAKG